MLKTHKTQVNMCIGIFLALCRNVIPKKNENPKHNK